mmetsp:Transcript_31265/g.47926  ORF Transcript_31265/g.47926 Transcript_31265/m.47926 type:complete len:362 (-) Transcript_31265:1214-2299(-)|eukprot:CAMPEP_0195289186 /NCGR_PEP_ID=MMETSP0707-20130614/5568_1 /TAXON_ID=33640 /ORGANISM="Asterionellopsis glacialis, Strain CCMP134" /LENGTH=361 /DNA_ID=CAMNT_0040349159 /DNA_START=109 /DNA_END=1194 /DNA_ORIENTATION=-
MWFRKALVVVLCLQLALVFVMHFYLSAEELSASSLWIQKVQRELTFTENQKDTNPRMFALLTDPRCIDAIPFVLENALDMLPESYKVVYFYATSTEECVKQWIQNSQTLAHAATSGRLVAQVDANISPHPKSGNKNMRQHNHKNWNNVMYTNITFWESLKVYGDSVLTIQADTYICQKGDLPLRWKTINYLGGMSKVDVHIPNYWNATNTHFLNGGFSIRRLDWVVGCLLNYTKGPHGEDTVFNMCPNGTDSVQILDAMAFSSDGGYTVCFDYPVAEQDKTGDGATSSNVDTNTAAAAGDRYSHGRRCPYGVHQPWRLGRARGSKLKEVVDYCPGIQTLSDKLGRNESNVARCLKGWGQCK